MESVDILHCRVIPGNFADPQRDDHLFSAASEPNWHSSQHD